MYGQQGGCPCFSTLKWSVKVPASAMSSEVDRESVQEKKLFFPEWVMISCQEEPNSASLCHCCFSNGEVLNSF